jgi:hypothetical protein
MLDVALPRLYERDIDVILQEELLFSGAVRDLVSKALRLAGVMRVEHCQLSVVDDSGETDVLALVLCRNERGALLIENKIDASFQPRQPERYRQRANSFGARDDLVFAHCVLVAPKDYLRAGGDAVHCFDATITYEELAEAIGRDGSPRSAYRASLLARAVEQARSAYMMVPSEAVGQLWQRIFRIAAREFPELKMATPSDKGSQSKWVIFKANLPPKITIDWKIPKATIDLSFWKGAKPQPNGALDLSKLRPNATRELLGTTIAIRIPLAPLATEWVAIPDEAIREALQAARELLAFFRKNPHSFS